jgi:DNA-binding PucR family transcriptional regulator
VRDLLDGLPVDHSKLPYLVSGVHVAAIATGEACDRALGQIASQLGLNRMTVSGPSGSVWAWFGGTSLLEVEAQRAIAAAVPEGVFVALGDPAEGLEGFRVSHREARHAYRIGRRMGVNAVQYADVALLSLATTDASLAREFMQRELGFLAEEDVRAEALRATLRAYFETGHNASAAAALLSLNDRTVAYRLRTIEDKLGRPITSRRDELSVALRLFEFFGNVEHPEARMDDTSDIR